MKHSVYKTITAVAMTSTMALSANAQNTPVSQMERLGRAPVAMKAQTGGIFLSWRLLGTDDDDATTFDVLCGGKPVVTGLANTNYVHAQGSATGEYQIVTRVNGTPTDTTDVVRPWAEPYTTLKLNRPEQGKQGGTYSPNDCSVADVDGDGVLELIVKWDPSNSKDNSQSGKTDNVYLDCYRFTGEQLWRIDLGVNIRAGAHYTQFMVYDFDGDGRAELMCKTAPGSVDGKGNYVNQAATLSSIRSANNRADLRTDAGRITTGQEYLTVFSGATGEAIHTIFYNPNRNQTYGGAADGSFNWGAPDGKGDTGSYGNRGERYLAAVAYLDGPDKNPCGVFCRGYYGYAFLWAVAFDGRELKQRWLHNSKSKTQYTLTTFDDDGQPTTQTVNAPPSTSGGGSRTMFANGNHNLSVADVDGDGCDEIIWGSAACNNDGHLLYATGFGHGDAIHMADLNPDRPGLEVFQVHEEKGTYAWDLHDAATGQILFKGGPAGVDNGRGMAAQLDANHRGCYFSSASERQQRSAVTGEVASTGQTSVNFRIYWDGDLQDELLDGTKIEKWTGAGTERIYIDGKNPYDWNGSSSCNGTKATPCLMADIMGDWREEIIYWSSHDSSTLNIFSTNVPTDYMLPTLLHDHTYRMGVCWQNVAYNQPPHLGFYLPDYFNPRLVALDGSPREQTVVLGDSMARVSFRWKHCPTPTLTSHAPDGTRKLLSQNLPGMSNTRDAASRTFTLEGKPEQAGLYLFVLKLRGNNGVTIEDTIKVNVKERDAIIDIASDGDVVGTSDTVYDLAGRPVRRADACKRGRSTDHSAWRGHTRRGIYIQKGKKIVR